MKRRKGGSGKKRDNWLLIKHRDELARRGRRGRHRAGGCDLGGVGPHHGGDRRRQGQGAQAVHDRQARRARPTRSGNATARPRRPGQGRRRAARPSPPPRSRRAAALFVAPQLAKLVDRPPGRGRLGPRDQVRRLSPAAARRGRQGDAEDPQGPRLDREVPGDRQARPRRCRTASSTARSARWTTTARPISPPCRRRCRTARRTT